MNVPIITYSNIYSGVCPASNNSWCFLNFELKSQTPHNTHLRQFPKCMCCPGKAADRPPLRCEQCNSYSHQNTASTGDESDQYYDSCPSQIQTQVVCPVHIVCIPSGLFSPLPSPLVYLLPSSCRIVYVRRLILSEESQSNDISTGAFLKCFFLKCSCNAFPLLYISPHPPQRSEPFPWVYSTWWSNQTWWLNSFAQRWHALYRSATHI